jgi:hypothetical protein
MVIVNTITIELVGKLTESLGKYTDAEKYKKLSLGIPEYYQVRNIISTD